MLFRSRLHLIVQFLHQLKPVVKADLEDLSVVNLGYPNEVKVAMSDVVTVGQVLDKLNGLVSDQMVEQRAWARESEAHIQMHAKEVGEEKG